MENNEENLESIIEKNKANNPKMIAGAIIIGFVLVAGAILLKGKTPNTPTAPSANPVAVAPSANAQIDPVSTSDHSLGNPNAKVTLVEYADFQCPFCGKFFKETAEPIVNTYVKSNKVQFVYRDFAFLGPESLKASEAAWCAGDQNKYWQYHDYLFTHQGTENTGAFADKNLKSFAKDLGLDTTAFNKCLDSGKYEQAVKSSTDNAGKVGVQGTPKSFILKDGKVFDTVDGAYPLDAVSAKLDAALK